MTLEPFIEFLRHHGRPDPEWVATDTDALLDAWEACSDAEPMIRLLRTGGAMGVFEADTMTEFGNAGDVHRWLFRLRARGKYYRIDVERIAGGAGVRACFPDFPDTHEWVILLAENRKHMAPLARFAMDLRSGREGSLDDEVRNAWSTCDEPMLMWGILESLGRADSIRKQIRWPAPSDRGGLLVDPRVMSELADEIRRLVPTL